MITLDETKTTAAKGGPEQVVVTDSILSAALHAYLKQLKQDELIYLRAPGQIYKEFRWLGDLLKLLEFFTVLSEIFQSNCRLPCMAPD